MFTSLLRLTTIFLFFLTKINSFYLKGRGRNTQMPTKARGRVASKSDGTETDSLELHLGSGWHRCKSLNQQLPTSRACISRAVWEVEELGLKQALECFSFWIGMFTLWSTVMFMIFTIRNGSLRRGGSVEEWAHRRSPTSRWWILDPELVGNSFSWINCYFSYKQHSLFLSPSPYLVHG